jgi:hypothetical protein
MKTLHGLTVAFFATLTLFFAGCSGADNHEKIADDAAAQMEKMANAVASVKDKASAEKAVAEMKAVAEELKKIAARAKAVGKPSAEVKAKIDAKMKPRQQAVEKQMVTAQTNLAAAGPEAAAILQKGMMELGQTMMEVAMALEGTDQK